MKLAKTMTIAKQQHSALGSGAVFGAYILYIVVVKKAALAQKQENVALLAAQLLQFL